eukprot:2923111-Rhodomonas_salina.2
MYHALALPRLGEQQPYSLNKLAEHMQHTAESTTRNRGIHASCTARALLFAAELETHLVEARAALGDAHPLLRLGAAHRHCVSPGAGIAIANAPHRQRPRGCTDLERLCVLMPEDLHLSAPHALAESRDASVAHNTQEGQDKTSASQKNSATTLRLESKT